LFLTFAIAHFFALDEIAFLAPRGHMSFCVTQSNSTLDVSPSRLRVVRTIAMLFGGGAAMLVGGVCMDLWSKDQSLASWFFTICGCLTAVLLWACGIWAWRNRNRLLSIDLNTQEVTFGNNQLCAPGKVAAVELRRDSNPDAMEPYSIQFRLIDGTHVNMPSPLFTGFRSFDEARNLAESLAAGLKVSVRNNT
jgi:hypothetical protein